MFETNAVKLPGKFLGLFVTNDQTWIPDLVPSCHLPNHELRIRPDQQVSDASLARREKTGQKGLVFSLVICSGMKNPTF
jgi:hypothetical protein